MMTPEEVKKLMESSKSEEEWNENCDTVKSKCNGYPDFWYASIILGGVLRESQNNW